MVRCVSNQVTWRGVLIWPGESLGNPGRHVCLMECMNSKRVGTITRDIMDITRHTIYETT